MESKPFYQSKSFWSAVLLVVVAIAKMFGIEGANAGQYDQTAELIVTAIGIVALRKATTQPMHFIAPKDDPKP